MVSVASAGNWGLYIPCSNSRFAFDWLNSPKPLGSAERSSPHLLLGDTQRQSLVHASPVLLGAGRAIKHSPLVQAEAVVHRRPRTGRHEKVALPLEGSATLRAEYKGIVPASSSLCWPGLPPPLRQRASWCSRFQPSEDT